MNNFDIKNIKPNSSFLFFGDNRESNILAINEILRVIRHPYKYNDYLILSSAKTNHFTISSITSKFYPDIYYYHNNVKDKINDFINNINNITSPSIIIDDLPEYTYNESFQIIPDNKITLFIHISHNTINLPTSLLKNIDYIFIPKLTNIIEIQNIFNQFPFTDFITFEKLLKEATTFNNYLVIDSKSFSKNKVFKYTPGLIGKSQFTKFISSIYNYLF